MMKIKECINGKIIERELSAEEISEEQAQCEQTERQYWQTVDYGDAINTEIRKRYTESQEFAILRQQEEKPEEYAEYYAYCEACKEYVKGKREFYAVLETDNKEG